MLKKSFWCVFAIVVLMAVPVYGSVPDEDAVYAYNRHNLFYAGDYWGSD
ncbi:hypothetical protein [Desulfallas thermosapovorans]|nr:hypothetical protein [Desulfallas thermosapovorans]